MRNGVVVKRSVSGTGYRAIAYSPLGSGLVEARMSLGYTKEQAMRNLNSGDLHEKRVIPEED
jgi:hypothetical protein